MAVGPQGEDEAEDVDEGQDAGDFFAERFEAVGLAGGLRAGPGDVEVERRHDQADGGQGEHGGAHAGGGAIELLSRIAEAADEN